MTDSEDGGGRARLRVNLAQREFEVEGSERFVASYAERIEALLDDLAAANPHRGDVPRPAAPGDGQTSSLAGFAGFGDFMQHLPRGATDVDRMLAAGYFAQAQSGDNAFVTADASRRLIEQGIRIGNPSQCVKQNLLAKRVFSIQRGRYRVSQQGMQHLGHLMGLPLSD